MSLTVKRPKIDRVVIRKGATAVVHSKPRSAELKIVRSPSPSLGEPQVTDLLAHYILLTA